MQAGDTEAEGLNAIFRAVHSIKAGAAAFNFTELVQFTHVFEALLDKLRSNRIQRSAQVLNAVVRGADLLADLVDAARSSRPVPPGFGADVASELRGLLESAPETPAAAAAPSGSGQAADGAEHTYRIMFEPHRELFRHANEPLLIIRELRQLGELTVECSYSALPSLASLDPEAAYLSFVFHLTTKAGLAAVNEAFEFVDQECFLKIEELSAGHGVTAGATAKPAADAAPALQAGTGTLAAKGATSIRVDLSRVDRLVNMVGELVITQAMLAEQLNNGGQRGQWNQGQRRTRGPDAAIAGMRDGDPHAAGPLGFRAHAAARPGHFSQAWEESAARHLRRSNRSGQDRH